MGVSIRGALCVLFPQIEVPVLARAGDKLGRLRDRDGKNLVRVAPQHLRFGPVARVPEADGLIGRRGDQTASVPGKRHSCQPNRCVRRGRTREPAVAAFPDADGGVFKSRARSQHPSVRRNGQRSQPVVPFAFGLPDFLARAEVNTLDAVAGSLERQTAQIQTPVAGIAGRPVMRV